MRPGAPTPEEEAHQHQRRQAADGQAAHEADRPEDKLDSVLAGRDDHTAQDGIGAINVCGAAVDASAPTGVMHLAQDEERLAVGTSFHDHTARFMPFDARLCSASQFAARERHRFLDQRCPVGLEGQAPG